MSNITQEQKERLARNLAKTLMYAHLHAVCQTTIENNIHNVTCINSTQKFQDIILATLSEYKMTPNSKTELAVAELFEDKHA